MTGDERERCWAKAVAVYAGYRGYAARAAEVGERLRGEDGATAAAVELERVAGKS